MKIEGLPVIDVDESEEITVAVSADDLLEGDTGDPERHPIALALRRQKEEDRLPAWRDFSISVTVCATVAPWARAISCKVLQNASSRQTPVLRPSM